MDHRDRVAALLSSVGVILLLSSIWLVFAVNNIAGDVVLIIGLLLFIGGSAFLWPLDERE